MNTDSGRLHALPDALLKDINVGDDLAAHADELRFLAEHEREASARELVDELDRGENIVAVGEDVVQKLRLGERELRRRKQRRS